MLETGPKGKKGDSTKNVSLVKFCRYLMLVHSSRDVSVSVISKS